MSKNCLKEINEFHNAQNNIYSNACVDTTEYLALQEKFHITYVKKIMHQYGMSVKIAQKYHINHTSAASVCNWQQYMKKRISRLKKNGFTIAMLDEAFFVRDVKSGHKYWSLVAKRIFLPYVGKHENFAACRTMLENGNQMFRIYKKFNSVTFVKYLRVAIQIWKNRNNVGSHFGTQIK